MNRVRLIKLLVLVLFMTVPALGQEPDLVPVPGLSVDDGAYAPRAILPGGIVLPLYTPDSEKLNHQRFGEAEVYNMAKGVPGRIQSIVNIHNPSIEVHFADPSINTGTVVVLAAGGGHRTLNVGSEAADYVTFFYNYGINTVILRNRLRSDGYEPSVDAVSDALQAIQLVRSHADEWNFDAKRIGIVGFSAGAELSGPAAIQYAEFDAKSESKVSSRPDFAVLVYPGPTPFTKEPNAAIPADAPPSFIATPGSGDRIHAIWACDYFNAMLRKAVPNIEMHVYGRGTHGGSMKYRNGIPLGTWQVRMMDWLEDLGFLSQKGTETQAAKDVAAYVASPPKFR